MATKLLLIQDVEDLGRSGDIVNVKPGYARNRLIPIGAAVIADRNAIRRQARLKEERVQQAAEDKKQSEDVAKRIEAQTVTITVKVDHDGHMYGSVTVGDIVRLLHEQLSVTIDKRAIQLKHPIKQTGIANIVVKLLEGVTAAFHLDVAAEGAAPQA